MEVDDDNDDIQVEEVDYEARASVQARTDVPAPVTLHILKPSTEKEGYIPENLSLFTFPISYVSRGL